MSTSEQQDGFVPKKRTTEMLTEQYGEDERKLHCVFVDLENRVPTEELW